MNEPGWLEKAVAAEIENWGLTPCHKEIDYLPREAASRNGLLPLLFLQAAVMVEKGMEAPEWLEEFRLRRGDGLTAEERQLSLMDCCLDYPEQRTTAAAPVFGAVMWSLDVVKARSPQGSLDFSVINPPLSLDHVVDVAALLFGGPSDAEHEAEPDGGSRAH